jgi:nucleoside-diphosphate-sugar epimerase
MKNKKILIIGSSGFLGQEVTREFIAKGINVIGIDPKKSDFAHPNFKEINEMLTLEAKTTGVKFQEISHIVNCAALLPYGAKKANLQNINIGNTKAVLTILSDFPEVRLVHISSSSVYGKPKNLPVNKNTELDPLDEYAKSKLEAENLIVNRLSKDRYAIVRPRTILGKGRSGIFAILFKLISKRIPIPMPNRGTQIVQFVHVKDLAQLVVHLTVNNISGIWPAGSIKPDHLLKALKELEKVNALKIRFIYIPTSVFVGVGKFLVFFRVTKFTLWHFKTFPASNYFDPIWKPMDFEYKFTSTEALIDSYANFFERGLK